MNVDDLRVQGVSDPVLIGQGGYGTVYRCQEIDLDRPVAVKVLSGQLDEVGRNRFERERRAMGVLAGHPNIVMVHRSGLTEAGRPYLVMEFLAGGSLADRLGTSGPLPWSTVLEIGIEICGALETAHREGVLHRDIKPANLLESNLGVVKLGDFGIARMQGAPETRSAMITASIAHAAPEIIDGKRPDVAADVYSLGSTLFELLIGSPAYVRETDESIVAIISRVAQDPIPDLRPLGVPDAACRAFGSAMAKDPRARPSSAEAFGRMLQAAQRSLGLAETPMRIEGERRVDLVGQPSPPTPQPTFNLPPPPSQTSAVARPPAGPQTAGSVERPTVPTQIPAARMTGVQVAPPSPPLGFVAGALPAPVPKRSKTWLWVTLGMLGFFFLGMVVLIGALADPERIEVSRVTVATDQVTVPSTVPSETTDLGSVTTISTLETPEVTESTPETPENNPPTTAATAVADGDIVFTGDYDAYVEVSGESPIRFEAPTEWSEVSITAEETLVSTDLNGLVGSYESSGVTVRSTILPFGASPDFTLDALPLAGCARMDDRTDVSLAGIAGRSVRVSGCGPSERTEVTYVALMSDDELFLIVIALQATDPRDGAAFARILETFEVQRTG